MDVLYRGEIFGGTINETKVYGFVAAALLHRYAQCEFIALIEKGVEPSEAETIFWFLIDREHIFEMTNLSFEEQKEAEEILKYFSVLEVSDDGENLVKIRINHKVEQALLHCPEYYIEQFEKTA
jgi:hypothetical protein